jgi:hypothetical protein
MKASEAAKFYGANSLVDVARASGYTDRGLRQMYKINPGRFELLCKGYVAIKLGLNAEQMKAASQLINR